MTTEQMNYDDEQRRRVRKEFDEAAAQESLTGGPAFPGDGPCSSAPYAVAGMTLLDYFAGQVMAHCGSADTAYKNAAGMIAARKKILANKES